MLTVEHGDRSDSTGSSSFDEFAYVVEGSVELMVGTEQHDLNSGDSMMLRAGRSHQWRNLNGGAARVLVVSNVGT